MKARHIVWAALLLLTVGLTVAEERLPYLPGDVAFTRLVQSALPQSTSWAGCLSSTAKMPWVLVLIGVTFSLSWAIVGWRAALLSLASIAGMWLLGMWLGPLIAQPRPSDALIQVAGSHSGSALPSQFALRYGATVGYLALLAALRTSGRARWPLVVICSCLLLAGVAGRLAVGAHWPSDIAVSYLIAFLWAALLLCGVPRPAPVGRRAYEQDPEPARPTGRPK
jgi:membrane-associated phospholipid phosphatase